VKGYVTIGGNAVCSYDLECLKRDKNIEGFSLHYDDDIELSGDSWELAGAALIFGVCNSLITGEIIRNHDGTYDVQPPGMVAEKRSTYKNLICPSDRMTLSDFLEKYCTKGAIMRRS